MAQSFNHGPGKSATTGETVTANARGSTASIHYVGPARDKTLYEGKVNGRYICEVAGANGTYRWIEDYRIGMAATPATGFTASDI